MSVWRQLGIVDVQGIDGDYVERCRLLIDEDRFLAKDLEFSFHLRRRFDLVQSLEVAEHCPERSASVFVESLVRHGEIVLFSAAAKGDGGDHHINEQDYDYWRQRFAQHGFVAFDYLRPLIQGNAGIEPWYLYNTFLYVAENRVCDLPECIRSRQVAEQELLQDISPLLWKLRKRIVRLLPVSLGTKLAKLKERWILMICSTRDER